jgi:hypothetical protein
LTAAAVGVHQVELAVEDKVRDLHQPGVILLDLPRELDGLARSELMSRARTAITPSWTQQDLPRQIAESVKRSGWVERLTFVRRTGDARFQISAVYRLPVAAVQVGSNYYLIDRNGVRLPGVYADGLEWKAIHGACKPTPPEGQAWDAEDIRAGLAVLGAVAVEPFCDQVVGVCVENHAGRRNRWASHILLYTDRPNGRIRWGSAPGNESEENTVAEKMAILRENHRRTGRLDAHYEVIDVSTFPDRFVIPASG